jgi:hypothetical protein
MDRREPAMSRPARPASGVPQPAPMLTTMLSTNTAQGANESQKPFRPTDIPPVMPAPRRPSHIEPHSGVRLDRCSR